MSELAVRIMSDILVNLAGVLSTPLALIGAGGVLIGLGIKLSTHFGISGGSDRRVRGETTEPAGSESEERTR